MNWKTTDIKGWGSLDQENYWYQGYFHVDFDDGTVYQRDNDELRIRDEAFFLLGDIEGKKILDMGCGQGLYSLTFLKMGAKLVCGQDIDVDEICIALEKMNGLNFGAAIGDCSKLQFNENEFDLVFAGDVFEHITPEQKESFITEAYRVLKPGGVFAIKTPNKNYLRLTNVLHRVKAILKFRKFWNIHIAHTRNNPDNEHHGLTTYKELIGIFDNTMFHPAVITTMDFNRSLPRWLCKILGRLGLSAQIVLSVRKPIFYGIYK